MIRKNASPIAAPATGLLRSCCQTATNASPEAVFADGEALASGMTDRAVIQGRTPVFIGPAIPAGTASTTGLVANTSPVLLVTFLAFSAGAICASHAGESDTHACAAPSEPTVLATVVAVPSVTASSRQPPSPVTVAARSCTTGRMSSGAATVAARHSGAWAAVVAEALLGLASVVLSPSPRAHTAP